MAVFPFHEGLGSLADQQAADQLEGIAFMLRRIAEGIEQQNRILEKIYTEMRASDDPNP